MRRMIWVSLLLNILVLLPVYLAILVVSGVLLFRRDPKLVAPLLAMQVLYKLSTPATVGTLANPVVISNLAIAAVHLITLTFMVREGVLGDGGRRSG